MKTQLLAIAVFVIILDLSVALAKRPGGPPPIGNNLWDQRVYRIEARNTTNSPSEPLLVLTAHESNRDSDSRRIIHATTSIWRDDPSQKWRLDASVLYDSYALHLTSNENFELEYNDNANFFRSLWSWGLGYNRYWYFIDAGEGYHMIKNHYNNVCLQSNGLDELVSTGICNNSIRQQWRVVFLSGLPPPTL